MRGRLVEDRAYLCSFHIPKVGGTTFASHARASLGDQAFLLHGPHARLQRFIHNQPQVEELSDADRAAIRVVHGHGADLSLAETMTGSTPELMIVLREPYARFVSGFHFTNDQRRNNALPALSLEEFFDDQGSNFYAKTLHQSFNGLIGKNDSLSIEALMPVLRSVKYFVLTERLDNQLPKICARYGIGAEDITPRRVNTRKTAVQLDTKSFYERNGVDQELYSILADVANRSDGLIQNPFGYDPGALKTYLQDAWPRRSVRSTLSNCYAQLVDAAKEALRLEALHLKLEHGSTTHVADRDLLLEHSTSAIRDWFGTLKRAEAAVAHTWSGTMFIRERNFGAAEKYLRKAIDLNPRNDQALAHLARLLLAKGSITEAADLVDQAASIRPERILTQKIRQAIASKNVDAPG
jgi:tetratricopeptide (TPR) repeat protein